MARRQQEGPSTTPSLGVVIVTYASGNVVLDCLESLLASTGVRLAVVVVDNASPDETINILQAWSAGTLIWKPPTDLPFGLAPTPKPLTLYDATDNPLAPDGHRVSVIQMDVNGGFAAGVNRGLAHLATDRELSRFWILNPDTVIHAGAAAAFANAPTPEAGFGLLGGRVIYLDATCNTIQIDGGVIDRRTGVTRNCHQYAPHNATKSPDPDKLDFVTGASLVVSRSFLDRAGPMPEDYFLYYEEVDWALRRGDLPIIYCPKGIVYHRAGDVIGSGRPGRPASPFSLYFMHRNRIRFMRRHFPASLPGAYAYSLAKAAQLASKGDWRSVSALLCGTFGRAPPSEVGVPSRMIT